MSEARAFDLLHGLFDPDDEVWWTAHGLVWFTQWARNVVQGHDEETRYWLTVYRELRARMA